MYDERETNRGVSKAQGCEAVYQNEHVPLAVANLALIRPDCPRARDVTDTSLAR
jgi:hypothetical protein